MSRRVVVVGSGACGTAAAYAAARAGANVALVGGRPGATSLASGALDDSPGPSRERFGDDRQHVASFLDALGLWTLADDGCRVATSAGILREARGRDHAVIDLAAIEGGTVAVLDPSRPGWDAAALSRAWSADPWARSRGISFEPLRVEALRFADESRFPDADLARRHDDPERVNWLAGRLLRSPDLRAKRALVIGLAGIRTRVAEALSRALSLPVGETLSMPGGVAGLRFELARDELLARSSVERVTGWAVSVEPGSRATRVEVDSGVVGDADAVILAVGGLAARGIQWTPDGFAPSFAGPAALAMEGSRLLPSGSPRGPLFETFAWSGQRALAGFERIGLWVDENGCARGADGGLVPQFYAAGDAAADRPRTLLEAIRSGLRVGELGAREPSSVR